MSLLRQRVTPAGAPVPAGVGPCAWRHSSGRPCGAAPGYRAAARLIRAAAFRSRGHFLSALNTIISCFCLPCSSSTMCTPCCLHPSSRQLSPNLLPSLLLNTGTCLRHALQRRSACGPHGAAACLLRSGAQRSRRRPHCPRCVLRWEGHAWAFAGTNVRQFSGASRLHWWLVCRIAALLETAPPLAAGASSQRCLFCRPFLHPKCRPCLCTATFWRARWRRAAWTPSRASGEGGGLVVG